MDDIGCVWVRETLVSEANQACQGTTRERCVQGTGGNTCPDTAKIGGVARCRGCGKLAAYGERGAGTVSIVETDFKGWCPATDPITNERWNLCDFKSGSTPACDCACSAP
jgi:hypothetical protein